MDNGAYNYERFINGEMEGLEEIVKEYRDGIMLFANGIVHNLDIAEEVAEDTFVKLVVKKPHFMKKSKFKTWLYKIARNIALDYIRKSNKYSCTDNENTGVFSNKTSVTEIFENSYLLEERKIAVHKALKNLNSDYRQVLYLSYFEELGNSQIATIMKKTNRQIENIIYRAKQSLRKELEKGEIDYEDI